MRKAIRWTAMLFGAAMIVLLVTGMIYEQVGRGRDAKRLPPRIGQAVDIGGRTMNLYCSGEGGPTVVFESGGDGLGYDWVLVQPEVAKFTRACWYDRAGVGWSDPPDRPRTSSTIVQDLHETLQRAGVAPPYVLVGGSVGGMYIRIFTQKYPSEVAGLVLVDASHPDQSEPPAMKSPISRIPPWVRETICAAFPLAVRTGVVRLMQPARVPAPQKFNAEQRRIYSTLKKQVKSSVAAGQQSCLATNGGRVFRDTGTGDPEVDDATRNSGDLGDRPVIVLTGGREDEMSPRNAEERQVAAFRNVWVNDLQGSLVKLSTRGKQIIVPKAGHMIGDEVPEAVVGAVNDVVEQARKR
jgi:pimeloyl-ACP methyl ester carboxylesterase